MTIVAARTVVAVVAIVAIVSASGYRFFFLFHAFLGLVRDELRRLCGFSRNVSLLYLLTYIVCGRAISGNVRDVLGTGACQSPLLLLVVVLLCESGCESTITVWT